jgi:hypothetical protein
MPPTTHLELPVICGTPALDGVVATADDDVVTAAADDVVAAPVLPGLVDVASVGAEVIAGV